MPKIYQFTRNLEGHRAGTHLEYVAPDDAYLTRDNPNIPWDMPFYDSKRRKEQDHLLQQENIKIDDRVLNNMFPQRNKDGTLLTVPPRGQGFKSDKKEIESIFQAASTNINVRCLEDDQDHFRNFVTPGLIDYVTDISDADSRKTKIGKGLHSAGKRDSVSFHKMKVKKDFAKAKSAPKTDPKQLLNLLMSERIEKQKNALLERTKLKAEKQMTGEEQEEVYEEEQVEVTKSDVAPEESKISEAQPTESKLPKSMSALSKLDLDELRSKIMRGSYTQAERDEYMHAIARERKRLGMSAYGLDTEPVCSYPKWVRYLYQKDQTEIGEHIKSGMGIMDMKLNPEFEAKMLAIRNAVSNRKPYGPSSYESSASGLVAIQKARFDDIRDLEKKLHAHEEAKLKKELLTQEKPKPVDVEEMNEALINARLMKYATDGVLLNLGLIETNKKKIASDFDLEMEALRNAGLLPEPRDPYDLHVGDMFKKFEQDMLDAELKKRKDAEGHGAYGTVRDQGDTQWEYTSEKAKESAPTSKHGDDDASSTLSDFLRLPSLEQVYRKFDLEKALKSKKKPRKRLDKSRRVSSDDLQIRARKKINFALPIMEDKNYPPNKDQDNWCMRRFKELLRKRTEEERLKLSDYDRFAALFSKPRFRHMAERLAFITGLGPRVIRPTVTYK